MTKLTLMIATAVALLATVLSPAHAQEQHTLQLQTVIVNDDPDLMEEIKDSSWRKQIPEIDKLGYGSNGFYYTIAMGNDGDDQVDDWAKWEFDSVDGTYEVQAWIPAQWATAHVQYLIWADENGDSTFARDEYVAGPWLNQQTNNGGWQSLGDHTLRGRVRIEVWDTRARDDWRDVDLENASIAVDAIRLLRIDHTSPEEPPTPPRSVVATPHGTNQIRVTWSAPANSGSSPISRYELEYSRPALRNHPLYGDQGPYNSGPFNINESSHTTPTDFLLSQVSYTVKVVAINEGGQRSEPAITTATTGTRSTSAPTRPRNVKAVPHGAKQLRVTWSPPSDSGSSQIKHYIVRYSRPAIGDSAAWSTSATTTDTSHTSLNRKYGTTYTVTVTAVNHDNRSSSAATTTATTRTRSTSAPTRPRNVKAVPHGAKQLRVTWSPPSDSGSSQIKHYIVRYSRPAIGDSAAWSTSATTTDTSHTSRNRKYGTTYTVTVTAVNHDNRSSSAATTTATTRTRTSTPPSGAPVITGLEWHESRFQKNEDVSITWSGSRVSGADSYKVEYRYVTYPRENLHFGDVTLSIPDVFAEPAEITVKTSGSEVSDGLTTTFRYHDAFKEDLVKRNNWSLQFRVIPLNKGTAGTASEWANFSDEVALRIIRENKTSGPCQALNVLRIGHDAFQLTRSASLIAKAGKWSNKVDTAALEMIKSLNPRNFATESALGTLQTIMGCFEHPEDAFKEMFPVVGDLMDAFGALDALKSMRCLYQHIGDAVSGIPDGDWSNFKLYRLICGF